VEGILRKLAGIDPESLGPGSKLEFELLGLPASWWAVFTVLVAGTLVFTVFALYRREGPGSPWRKRLLSVVRLSVFALLFLILFEPTVVPSVERTLEAFTVVMVDDSLSMSLKDRYEDPVERESITGATAVPDAVLAGGVARHEIVEGLLNNEELGLLRRLGERNRVRLFTFSSASVPLEPGEGAGDGEGEEPERKPVELSPSGGVTSLSGGIRSALSQAGRPIAGLVLISDGRFNTGEGPSSCAEFLRNKGIRAWAVGVGADRDPKNVRIQDLVGNEAVYLNDPVLFEVRFASTGLAGAKAVLKLTEASGEGAVQRTVHMQDVTLEGGEQRVSIRFAPERAGKYVFTAEIEPLEDEISTEDNTRSMSVKVLEERIKVLLVSGKPTFEYRYVKNLLMREKSASVSCWLQSADPRWPQEGEEPLEALPREEKALFEFDVVFLFDADTKDLDRQWVDRLSRFVGEHGGGLLFVAGEKFAARTFSTPGLRSLHDLLPVVPDMQEVDVRGMAGQFYPTPWRIDVADEGALHPLTRFDDDAHRNNDLWHSLPGFFFHFPVKKLKPGATALLLHSGPHARNRAGPQPLLAVQFFGPGRSAFMGFDETWRWRSIAEEYFNAFWVHMVRYLSEGRLLGEKKRALVLTDKDTYTTGDTAHLRLRLLNEAYEPVRLTGVSLKIRGGKDWERVVELKPEGGKPGWFEGIFIPPEPGLYGVHAHDLGPVRLGREALRTVRVELPALEFAHSRMDRDALSAFAEKTGGRLVPLDEVAGIPDDIPAMRERTVLSGRPVKLWDNVWVLLLLLGLLTFEWVMRKIARMA